MKREDLQGLGLSDEQVGSVMAMHSSELNDTRSKLTAAEQERDSFKTQIDSNNSELESLREASKDNEELQSKLDDLQATYDQSKKDSEEQLLGLKKDNAINSKLAEFKARNNDAVRGLLKLDDIKLDDEGIHGLSEQLEALKESDGYLFEETENNDPKSPINATAKGNPSGGKQTTQNDAVAEALGLTTK